MLTSFAPLVAQKVSFAVNPVKAADGVRLSVQPVGTAARGVELVKGDDGVYRGEITASAHGFYSLYYTAQSSPIMLPVYVPQREGVSLDVALDGFSLSTQLSDSSNRALSGYGAALADRSLALMKNLESLSEDEIKASLAGYVAAADSVLAVADVPEDVERYIRVWAYTSACDALATVKHVRRFKGNPVNIGREDVLPAPDGIVDSRVASWFPSAVAVAAGCVEGNTIEERLADLHKRFSTPEVVSRVRDMLLSGFLDSFNYSSDFEGGEKRLMALTEQYGLPQNYLTKYRERKCSIPGTPFPDIRLVDRDGKTVDFSSFAGKYVYIDLWASWCGPCVREVPHLKELEKAMEGGNVVFVSISIDSDRESWIERMEALDMHGNQLWDIDGKIGETLNVRGIPHFMLYDREGKLLEYKMTRPSNVATGERLRSLK